MAARKRRRRRPRTAEPHVEVPAPPATGTERTGPITIPEWEGEAQPDLGANQAPLPPQQQHQIPAFALAQFYQHVALPLAGVMAAVSMQRTQLSFHPLAPSELDARFDRFLEALTATHSHAGACLAVLQEMQESELGE